jgi:hypothetical protein
LDDKEVRELIMKRQSNSRIACATAFKIAEETGRSRREIGEILNELKIKIHSCQLGCFE